MKISKQTALKLLFTFKSSITSNDQGWCTISMIDRYVLTIAGNAKEYRVATLCDMVHGTVSAVTEDVAYNLIVGKNPWHCLYSN